VPSSHLRRFTGFSALARVICGSAPYPDVGPWLAPAVTWLQCDAMLLRGSAGGSFFPQDGLTRVAFARLLHDASGRPTPPPPAPGAYPVDDVARGNQAIVRWATHDPDDDGPLVAPMTGYADHTFRPRAMLSRAQAVNAVWRWAGRPAGFEHGFVDVPSWVEEAVAWAQANGVVAGFAGNAFRPRDVVKKGQAVQMLYRADLWLDAP
jgi:hypothetical protein